MRRVNRLLNYKFFSLLGNFLAISCFGVKLEKNLNVQGRQSVPKSGRSEWGGERNFGVYQTTAPKNLLLKGDFSGRGRKSGSAYALLDLVTLAPLDFSNDYNQYYNH